MAAVLMTTIQNFIGTNTERIALTTTGLKPGTTFYCTDTTTPYVLDGGGNWVISSQITSIPAGSAIIGKVGIDQTTDGVTNGVHVLGTSNPSFNPSVALIRPANTTPYAATPQSINCDLTVTEVSYASKVVTLKAAGHGLVPNDRITVAGVNTGATVTNIDGNWIVATADTDHITFSVSVQPTGTTPQTGLSITHAIAKCLYTDFAPYGITAGSLVTLSALKLSMPGVAMIGATRVYIYTKQPTVLVDQSAFTILAAYNAYRKRYINLYPVTEATGSDCAFAQDETIRQIRLDPSETGLYYRVCSETAQTPVSTGVLNLDVVGFGTQG